MKRRRRKEKAGGGHFSLCFFPPSFVGDWVGSLLGRD